MTQQFANDARAVLAADITDSATSIVLEAGFGDRFPVADLGTGVPGEAEGDWFKATLENATGQREIVIVRTRASGSDVLSNVQRGIESTTARAYSTGDVIGQRPTAGDVAGILGFNPAAYVPRAGDVTIAGPMTFGGSVDLNGLVRTPVPVLTGTTPVIASANGAMQRWTTSGNSTPTFNIPQGTSVTLFLGLGGSHTVNWSGITAWTWGTPPVMTSGQVHIITIFNYNGSVRADWSARF